MKYFLMLAGDSELGARDQLTPDQIEAEMGRHHAFGVACEARDGVEMLGGEALGDGSTATSLLTRNGTRTITDGPFAEAAEQIGGFYLIDAPDIDTVIELARILPENDIDIRPVLDVS